MLWLFCKLVDNFHRLHRWWETQIFYMLDGWVYNAAYVYVGQFDLGHKLKCLLTDKNWLMLLWLVCKLVDNFQKLHRWRGIHLFYLLDVWVANAVYIYVFIMSTNWPNVDYTHLGYILKQGPIKDKHWVMTVLCDGLFYNSMIRVKFRFWAALS